MGSFVGSVYSKDDMEWYPERDGLNPLDFYLDEKNEYRRRVRYLNPVASFYYVDKRGFFRRGRLPDTDHVISQGSDGRRQ